MEKEVRKSKIKSSIIVSFSEVKTKRSGEEKLMKTVEVWVHLLETHKTILGPILSFSFWERQPFCFLSNALQLRCSQRDKGQNKQSYLTAGLKTVIFKVRALYFAVPPNTPNNLSSGLLNLFKGFETSSNCQI